MLFNTIEFLAFFSLTIIVFFILPQKIKNIWLLFMSYIFYMGWNKKYLLLLVAVTAATYITGRMIEIAKNHSTKKAWLFTCICFK